MRKNVAEAVPPENSLVCGSGGYPLIVPIQAAGLADLNVRTDLRRL